MSSELARQAIDQATAALKAGKNSEALRLLDTAADLFPDDASVLVLRGIAFAQVGRAEPATEFFRKATVLDPSFETLFDLAVHFHNIGDKADAIEAAQRCLKVDPANPLAQKLLATVQAEGDQLKFSVQGVLIAGTHLARKRRYGYGRKHLFAILAENQEPWVAFGWTIVALSIVAAILMKVNFPFIAPTTVRKEDFKNSFLGYKPAQSFSAFATIAFFATTILASMIWTSLDLIDRRGRALWMIPMMLCCFLFLPFIPQAFYIYVGRREPI